MIKSGIRSLQIVLVVGLEGFVLRKNTDFTATVLCS